MGAVTGPEKEYRNESLLLDADTDVQTTRRELATQVHALNLPVARSFLLPDDVRQAGSRGRARDPLEAVGDAGSCPQSTGRAFVPAARRCSGGRARDPLEAVGAAFAVRACAWAAGAAFPSRPASRGPSHEAVYRCFDDYEACLRGLDRNYTTPGAKARIFAYCEAVGAVTANADVKQRIDGTGEGIPEREPLGPGGPRLAAPARVLAGSRRLNLAIATAPFS